MYTDVVLMSEKKEKEKHKKEAMLETVGRELAIPQGTTVEIKGEAVYVKGQLGENVRKYDEHLLKISKEGDKLMIKATQEKSLRKKGALSVNSVAKEIKNDIDGVNKYFEVQMETIFLHFPITLEAKGAVFTIKNIFGERKPRTAKIVGSAKVEVKDKNVRIFGTSINDVSQTAANIRQACKINNKDERVFQDGVYFVLE